jgi:serine/threonine protein kinase
MIEDQRATFSGVPDEAAVHSETLSRRQKDWLEAAGSVATLDWRQGSDSGSERSIVDASQAALGFSEALSMLPARESFGGAGSAPPFDPAVMSTGGEPATGLAPNGAPAGADDSVGATTPPPRNPFNGAGGHGTADYLLRKKIGEGGMGVVWQATQTSLSREVAVKRLKGDADWMDFLQEAFTSAELDHPNIVPVHDLARLADSASGGQATPAIAMKMVTGTAWNVLIKSDRKAADLTREDFLAKHLRILIDVCHAVAYAHAKHIVHRDLKPHQVMLGEFGEVFLMDWGLAITMLEEAPTVPGQGIPKHRSRTTGGNPCGSPAYMAPEQTDATAARLGPATDIYLLGAILYELVCGHPPHYAENGRAAFALATANERDPVPPDAPEELLALIEEALATKPEERPASVALFRDRIEDYLSGAGKRRESRELAGKARQKLDEAEADYGVLSECLAIAARSRALWSDNPALPPLEADIFHAYAEAAISHGDLTLAKVHAERISASDPRRADSPLARVAELEALLAPAARGSGAWRSPPSCCWRSACWRRSCSPSIRARSGRSPCATAS